MSKYWKGVKKPLDENEEKALKGIIDENGNPKWQSGDDLLKMVGEQLMNLKNFAVQEHKNEVDKLRRIKEVLEKEVVIYAKLLEDRKRMYEDRNGDIERKTQD